MTAAFRIMGGSEAVPEESRYVGQPVERLEDGALLTGRGRYADDLPVRPDTLYAAVLRSPHPHGEILAIDTSAALKLSGVAAVITREDVTKLSTRFVVGVKQPLDCWALAVDRVRYVGEPVAVVLAEDRYVAEDALEHIAVQYQPLPAMVDPLAAASAGSPLLFPAVGSNVVSERTFRYGEPDTQFAAA